MHPFLKSPKHIFFLVLVWLGLSSGIIFLDVLITKINYIDAAIFLGPVLLVQLFVFLSVWFVCKSAPLSKNDVIGFLVRHLITIIVMNAFWLYMTKVYSELLAVYTTQEFWRVQFDSLLPLLTVIGFFAYFLSSLMSYLILAIEETREAEQQALQNQLKASQAELRFLKATIHPHFLFNSLTALSTLTKTSSEKAQQVCLQLADFLRYSLNFSNREFVSVEDELKHIENFLSIEKVRLGRRLKVELNVDEDIKSVYILSFSLQPLIENAIKHGIEKIIDGGTLGLSVKNNQENLYIEVTNPFNKDDITAQSTGYGLQTLKNRLEKSYKQSAKLLVHKGECVFSVHLYLPLFREVTKQDA